MAGLKIAHGLQQATANMRNIDREVGHKALHALAVDIKLAGRRTSARKNGKLGLAGKKHDLPFFNPDQGTDDRMTAVVCQHLRTHCRKPPDKKLVEQQGFNGIVEVMPQGNLVAAEAIRYGIEVPPAQAGTKRTVGGSGAQFGGNDTGDLRAF
jgi:hypothetical protein